jgi:tetratricopeptide (TPR) repeat protein
LAKINRPKTIAAAHKYLAKGNLKRAVKEYEKVLKDDPSDIRTKLKVADLLFKLGDHEKAVRTFHEVADFYASQGFLLKAVAVYKQVQRVKPDNVEVHLSLAALYEQIGLVGDAIIQYRDAIGLLEKSGESLRRLKVAQKMLGLDPDNAKLRIGLAEDFVREGMLDEAVAEFRSAYDALRRQELDEESVVVAERLLYFHPDDWDVAKDLAAEFIANKDGLRALSRLQACYKVRPNDPEVLDLLAQVFEFLGQPQKAATILKLLARQYDRTGLIRERDEIFQKVLVLSPGDKVAADALQFGSAVPVQSGAEIVFEHSDSNLHEEFLVADEDIGIEEIGIDEVIEDTDPDAAKKAAGKKAEPVAPPKPVVQPEPPKPPAPPEPPKPPAPPLPEVEELDVSDVSADDGDDFSSNFEERTLIQPMVPFSTQERPTFNISDINIPPVSDTKAEEEKLYADVPKELLDDVQNLEFLIDVGMTEDALDLIAELRAKAGNLAALDELEKRIQQ